MYELFCAFFPILISFSLKPLTRNHSYISWFTTFFESECDEDSATWHFYHKHDRQNPRGSDTTRYWFDVGVVGGNRNALQTKNRIMIGLLNA